MNRIETAPFKHESIRPCPACADRGPYTGQDKAQDVIPSPAIKHASVLSPEDIIPVIAPKTVGATTSYKRIVPVATKHDVGTYASDEEIIPIPTIKQVVSSVEDTKRVIPAKANKYVEVKVGSDKGVIPFGADLIKGCSGNHETLQSL
nr:hypothetical protein [Rhodobacter aestuarii]